MDFRASFTEIVTAVGGVQEEFFFLLLSRSFNFPATLLFSVSSSLQVSERIHSDRFYILMDF